MTKWTEKYPKIKTEFDEIDQSEYEEVKQERIDVQEVLELDVDNIEPERANQSDEFISINTEQSDTADQVHSTLKTSEALKQTPGIPKSYPVGNPIPTSYLYLPPNPMVPSTEQIPPTDTSEMGYLAQLGAKKAQKKEFQRNEDGFFPCERKLNKVKKVKNKDLKSGLIKKKLSINTFYFSLRL